MNKSSDLENDYLRRIILGHINFRKCPACDNQGIGFQTWNESGEPCLPTDETAWRETCEECDGVAFIEIPND